MKVLEVPVFNDDGSVKVTHALSPDEAQTLLQFALNFLTATGLNTTILVGKQQEDSEEELPEFND